MLWPDGFNATIRHHNLQRDHVIGCCAVNRATRTGGIVGDHSAQRGARAGCYIRSETKIVRLQEIVELVQYDAGADADAALFKIKTGDLPVVTREFNDQSFADRIPDETRAGTSRSHWHGRVGCGANDCARLLRVARKRDAERLDLINGSVSRIKLSRQIVETRVASGLPYLFFLRGSHFVPTRNRSTGFQPVRRAGRLAWRLIDSAGSKPTGPTARMAMLQQIHLGIVWRRLGKTDAQADEAHRFSGAGKCFG